jgi:hypothetical protein
MDIELLGNRKVAISTPQHLQEALDFFGEVLTRDVVNPANSKLFTICKEAKLFF